MLIDRDKVISMLNSNNISHIYAPVGEHHSTIGGSVYHGIGVSHEVGAVMFLVPIEMVGNQSMKWYEEGRHIELFVGIDKRGAENVILHLGFKMGAEHTVV